MILTLSVAVALCAGGQDSASTQGRPGPGAVGAEPLDALMEELLEVHGLPGAALAVARKGELLYARGFGWADVEAAGAIGGTCAPATAQNMTRAHVAPAASRRAVWRYHRGAHPAARIGRSRRNAVLLRGT